MSRVSQLHQWAATQSSRSLDQRQQWLLNNAVVEGGLVIDSGVWMVEL